MGNSITPLLTGRWSLVADLKSKLGWLVPAAHLIFVNTRRTFKADTTYIFSDLNHTKRCLIYMLKNEHKVFIIHKKANNQLGIIALIKRSKPINLITGPIIYAMIFPILLLDLFVWFYQLTCFPVYKLAKFDRSDFIIFDRQELKYLDWASKFHCTYCAYAVGVINLVGAIIGATESYFCPIKHKRNRHKQRRKTNYINFENTDDYDFDEKLSKIRKKITSNR